MTEINGFVGPRHDIRAKKIEVIDEISPDDPAAECRRRVSFDNLAHVIMIVSPTIQKELDWQKL